MMKTIDYNDGIALSDFADFLAGPNVMPITIGHVGGTIIQLYAGDHHLDAHELPDDAWGDVDENRAAVNISVLGLWEDASQLRRGHPSDEGHASDGTPSASTTDAGSLEVFQQLGLLAYREPGSKDDFESSNYVLVTSVYDDSIWVLWRKYILDENTLDMDLTSDVVWQGNYAVFPGTPKVDGVRETIVYARLTDNWADLKPSAAKALKFSHIRHAPSTCDSRPEPILVR